MPSDIVASKAMGAEMLQILGKQYAAYLHWSYRLHADNLSSLIKRRPELGEAPSYAAVMRRIQECGWYKKKSGKRKNTAGAKEAAERLESLEVRSYEAAYVNLLWHFDFHTGRLRVVGPDGEWYSPKALAVLDDRSRLCCHIQWYKDESAETLFHGLSQSFHKRGLPRGLMMDNGPAMLARETENGLTRLGIKQDQRLPYSPYSILLPRVHYSTSSITVIMIVKYLLNNSSLHYRYSPRSNFAVQPFKSSSALCATYTATIFLRSSYLLQPSFLTHR